MRSRFTPTWRDGHKKDAVLFRLQRGRFLERLRRAESQEDALRTDRALAAARSLLAVTSLVAIYLDPTEPSRFEALAYSLLAFYAAYSVLILLLAGRRPFSGRTRASMHAFDILWVSTITTFTTGPNSPFFVFVLFVLLAAAYRWGFRETILSAVVLVVIMIVQAFDIAKGGPVFGVSAGEFDLNRLIMRCTYLVLMGFLLGYLAENEKLHRAETAAVARLLARIQAERGLRACMQVTMDEILRVSRGASAVAVFFEESSGRLFLWEARVTPSDAEVQLHLTESHGARHAELLFPLPAHTVLLTLRRPAGATADRVAAMLLDASGKSQPGAEVPAAAALLSARGARSLIGLPIEFTPEWSARLLVFDPQLGPDAQTEIRFLQRLVREVAPAMHSVYLVRRLRTRAGAVERSRVARELHDGAIQSLIALEMQMDVLRRQADGAAGPVGERLTEMQELVHQEVLNLRELMEQIKPLEVGPGQLADHLAGLADKFSRETGIAAEFVCPISEPQLPPRAAREISRIVQEALVNVRKHSGAQRVSVRLDAAGGGWRLVVDDNGRGFDFSGRRSQAELDAQRRGPLVIKERVRTLGGELVVESTPGRGARLEITFPMPSHG